MRATAATHCVARHQHAATAGPHQSSTSTEKQHHSSAALARPERKQAMANTPQTPPSRLESFKTSVEAIQALFAIIAFAAAGWWFWQQHFMKKQIKIEQQVTQRPLYSSPGESLLFVDIKITNSGKIPVNLKNGTLSLYEVNPEPATGPTVVPLSPMTLEPGESDQAFFSSVHVPGSVKTIELHSSYPDPDNHLSWNAYSVIDIATQQKASADARSAAASVHP